MLKRILVVGVTCLVFVSAFAQQKETNPNVDKMQQLLNQAGSQARDQFNKTYSPPASVPGGKSSPTTTEQPASPPPVQPMVRPEQPSPVQSSPKVPDVAVSPSDTSGSSVGNMYAPGGNAQDSNNGSANPYR